MHLIVTWARNSKKKGIKIKVDQAVLEVLILTTFCTFGSKSDQGTFTPVSAQGVPLEPPKKITFPPEFCNEICTIYVCTIKNHNSGEKN